MSEEIKLESPTVSPSGLPPVLLFGTWVDVDVALPPLGAMCWLWDGSHCWIGDRSDADGEGWLWTRNYGMKWWNGTAWDGDCEMDDDYKVSHWQPLPIPPGQTSSQWPNEKAERPA